MGRKFKNIETAEQAYARQSAPAHAEAAWKAVRQHNTAASHEEQQTSTASYSTAESRAMGIAGIQQSPDAERHSRSAKRHREMADAKRAEAKQAEEDAKPKKKRSWW
jgi:hypothetical protein